MTHPDIHPSLSCKNCASPLTDRYCARCGQDRLTDRITFGGITQEFVEQVINLDAGFLRTIRSLSRRPGHFIREYLLGQRRPYLKPLQFYLVMLALFFLLTELLHVDPLESGRKISEEMQPGALTSNQAKMQAQVQALLSSNTRVLFSLLVIFKALALWIVYRKRGWYYIEWLIFSLFVIGYQYFFSMLLPVAPLVVGHHTTYYVITSLVMVVSSGYSVWAIVQFSGRNNFRSCLTAIAAVLLTYLLFITFSTVLGGVIGLWYSHSQ